MGRAVDILRTVGELRAHVAQKRAGGDGIALVPTMGALHRGHVSLVEAALADGDAAGLRKPMHVIVSIFVNPTQFAPNEDFSSYPRTLDADLEKVLAAGAHAIYAPSVEAMYAPGFATTIELEGPAAVGLDDAFRPTHFAGVATVVAKLLIQAKADIATFGEKDYQQLQVVTRMVRDLDLETRILAVPTFREADGLALSSRNVYLSAEERMVAPTLHRVLTRSAMAISDGRPIVQALAAGLETLTQSGFAPDYLEARNASTLQKVESRAEGPIRLLVAARLGRTRLIDNIAV